MHLSLLIDLAFFSQPSNLTLGLHRALVYENFYFSCYYSLTTGRLLLFPSFPSFSYCASEILSPPTSSPAYLKKKITGIIHDWKQAFKVVVSLHLELLPPSLICLRAWKTKGYFFTYEAVIFISLSALAKHENWGFNLAGQLLRHLLSSDQTCISQD